VVLTWLDADQQKAKELLQNTIHYVTPAKCKHFNDFFQHHYHQQLQVVGTNATCRKRIVTKILTRMNTPADESDYRVVNTTPNNDLEFQVSPSDV